MAEREFQINGPQFSKIIISSKLEIFVCLPIVIKFTNNELLMPDVQNVNLPKNYNPAGINKRLISLEEEDETDAHVLN